jgi:hypothetical protein
VKYFDARTISSLPAFSSPELGIETWELDTFQDPATSDLPIIVPLAEVHCQLSRGRIEHTDPKMWITATMDRVCGELD